jgi:hypothetical protein
VNILSRVESPVDLLYRGSICVVEFKSLLGERHLYDLPELLPLLKSTENPFDVVGRCLHYVERFPLSKPTEQGLNFDSCEELHEPLGFCIAASTVILIDD